MSHKVMNDKKVKWYCKLKNVSILFCEVEIIRTISTSNMRHLGTRSGVHLALLKFSGSPTEVVLCNSLQNSKMYSI